MSNKEINKIEQSPVEFSGDLLFRDDREFLTKRKLVDKTTQRRARYWCYRFRGVEVDNKVLTETPGGFKDFVESIEGFQGWGKFADT